MPPIDDPDSAPADQVAAVRDDIGHRVRGHRVRGHRVRGLIASMLPDLALPAPR